VNTLLNNSDLFLTGFRNTLLLFSVSAVCSLILGTIVAALRVSPVPAMRGAATLYVNVVRNTPLTLILFFFALGYPKLGLVPIDFTTAAIIGLSLYTATYVSEAVRSGINTVPVGQAEAARAIGLPFMQTLSLVILKNTTVAAGFSVFEAGAIRANLSERGEPAMAGLLWIALVFIILVFILSFAQRKLEQKWKVAR
jgi:glutamate transport system permease protein